MILYRFWSADHQLLYVGITENLQVRLKDHRKKDWFAEVALITTEDVPTVEAPGIEQRAIVSEVPLYNILHTPDTVRKWNTQGRRMLENKAYADAMERRLIEEREQQAIREEIRMVVRAIRSGPCVVCLGPIVTRYQSKGWKRTCSDNCHLLYMICRSRFWTDEQRARYKPSAKRKLPSEHVSRYVGVNWHKPAQRWQAVCARKTLGYFRSEEDAARAYDSAARQRWAINAVLNFPGPGEQQAVKGQRTASRILSPRTAAAWAEVERLRAEVAARGENWWS